MRRPQVIAAISTLIAVIVILLTLTAVRLTVSVVDKEWPPRRDGSIALAEQADEQYFDVVAEPMSTGRHDPSPAELPEPQQNRSEAAPATGHDVRDAGLAADAPAVATTRRESPVKAKKEEPKKAGPSKEELEREEARRRASAATANAFKRAKGSDNTTSQGKQPGQSGSPDGTSSAVNGSGTGTVGGGWVIPRYAQVPSTVTGSIKMQVKIDRTGRVTSLSFTGGQPPAATDAALRRAVEREVRSRAFTRSDAATAPPTATAYITYTFR
ncbi:MAG: hypothetical protein NC406_05165 [Bacteroides sp.]|nr:hypothetical protein [Bacteroides sp.]